MSEISKAMKYHHDRLSSIHCINMIHKEQNAIETTCGLSGRVVTYAGSMRLGIVAEATFAYGSPDYIIRCMAEDADPNITCRECQALLGPGPKPRTAQEMRAAPGITAKDVAQHMRSDAPQHTEVSRAMLLDHMTDAGMAEAAKMLLIHPMPRNKIALLASAMLDRHDSIKPMLEATQPHNVTRPSITTDQYLTIVNAVMTKQKELQPDKARRFHRQDAMRYVTTMLDTQAALAAGAPTTGVPFPPSEFDAQLQAVKDFIGAAITFMNYAAGEGIVYCPDENAKPDNDHPAQPDTAMMKLWQAFGEPGEEGSAEQHDKLLTGAVVDLLGL